MKRLWLQVSQYVDTPDWRERKSWHDTVWLLVPILAVLVAGPVWFFRLVEVDMNSLTWSLFAYSLLRETGNFYLEKSSDSQVVLRFALACDLAGVCVLGLLWHFSQTVFDPLFLLVMVIPLIAGAMIYPSFITHTFTGVSIMTVLTVAWLDVPQFRVAVLQSSFVPAWIAARIGGGAVPAMAASDSSAANAAAVLVGFCFSLIIISCVIDGVRRYFMNALQNKSSELAIVSAERRPTLSIDRKTFTIISSNQAFQDYSLSDPARREPLALASAGQGILPSPTLFEMIRFEEERDLRQMIARNGGALLCHYRVGPEARVGRVRVDISPDGLQCQLSMEDLSTESYLRQTLDVLNQAVILLAESEVVLYFNSAAGRLFPDLVVGVEAVEALEVETLGAPWWEMGSSARHNRNVQLNGRAYRAACTAAQLPGQDMQITVLSLSEV